MSIPQDYMYTATHEWIQFLDETTAKVGITDFAQSALGDIVYIGLPEIGFQSTAKEVFADIESVKAASDIFCPVTGIVTEINDSLTESPEQLNENPFSAWLATIASITDKSNLLTAKQYEDLMETGE